MVVIARMGGMKLVRKIKGRKFVYWPHPTAKGKYVKAKVLKNGKTKIVDVVPASQVPKKRRRR